MNECLAEKPHAAALCARSAGIPVKNEMTTQIGLTFQAQSPLDNRAMSFASSMEVYVAMEAFTRSTKEKNATKARIARISIHSCRL